MPSSTLVVMKSTVLLMAIFLGRGIGTALTIVIISRFAPGAVLEPLKNSPYNYVFVQIGEKLLGFA